MKYEQRTTKMSLQDELSTLSTLFNILDIESTAASAAGIPLHSFVGGLAVVCGAILKFFVCFR